MYTIRTLNAISPVGLAKLPQDEFLLDENEMNPHGIVLRSAEMKGKPLNEDLLGVARAGAGTNNIPIEECTEKGIPVFNTPGANANAVKELVLTGLLLTSRRVIEGANWTQGLMGQEGVAALVEKGKKQFAGPEISGKKLGVIGLGAIGGLVANTALDLGMDVIGYDPYLSIESAWHLSGSVKHARTIEEVVANADYISLHVPLVDATKKLFNEKLFSVTKKGVRLLNFARGGLVDTNALKAAIADGTVACYMVDFPEEELLGLDNVIVTPHLGASTPESEDNCAVMAVKALREYLRYGNIRYSVNFPECWVPYSGKPRVAVSHKNIVNMIASLANVFTKYGINIDNMVNKSKGDLAYNLIICDDLRGQEEAILADLYAINSVIRVRIISGNN